MTFSMRKKRKFLILATHFYKKKNKDVLIELYKKK